MNDTEDDSLAKDGRGLAGLIDMNKILRSMERKIVLKTLTFGYVFYGFDTSSVVNSGTNLIKYFDTLNKLTIKELSQNIGLGTKIVPVSPTQIKECESFYNKNPTCRLSSSAFKGELFSVAFDVIINDSNGKPEFEIKKEIRDLVIKNFWMPEFGKHYDWIKICGICPIYFEPIAIKTKSGIWIDYVIQIPPIDSGVLYTYTNISGVQTYLWKWIQGTGGVIGSPTTLDLSNTSFMDNDDSVGIAGGVIDGMVVNIGSKVKSYLLRKSRYMFFHTANPPSLSGELKSDVMSVMPRAKQFEAMLEHMLIGGQNMIYPSQYVEFLPDLDKATSGDSYDMMRLQVELAKEREKSSLYGLANYSNVYGEEIESPLDNMAHVLESGNTATGVSATPAMARVYELRDKLTSRASTIPSAESDLGLNFNSGPISFGTTDVKSVESKGEMERVLLHTKNNPNSPVSNAYRNMVISKMTQGLNQTNVHYLRPYEKMSSGGRDSKMPTYDIKYFDTKLTQTVSSICDFPIDLTNSGTSVRNKGSDPNTSTTNTDIDQKKQILEERLRAVSKKYEELISQLWVMSHTEMIKNTKRAVKNNQKVTQYDFDTLNMYNKLKITFPRTPYASLAVYREMYMTGIIDEQTLYNFSAEKLGLEEKTLNAQEIKTINERLFPPEPEKTNEGGGSDKRPKKKAKTS